jgi:hypothetical protein
MQFDFHDQIHANANANHPSVTSIDKTGQAME